MAGCGNGENGLLDIGGASSDQQAAVRRGGWVEGAHIDREVTGGRVRDEDTVGSGCPSLPPLQNNRPSGPTMTSVESAVLSK